MKRTSLQTNSNGFAHPLVFVLVIVGIVGLVGFAGYRVMGANSAQNVATTNSVVTSSKPGQTATDTETALPQTTVAAQPKQVAVKKQPLTAASKRTATTSQPAPAPEVQVNSVFDLTTAEGSLNYLISDLQAGKFETALYFVTPRFFTQVAQKVNVSEAALSLERCKQVEACAKLFDTKLGVISPNDRRSYSADSVTAEGASLVFYLKQQGSSVVQVQSVAQADYVLTVDMLNIIQNWVVDRIHLNGYTL